MKLRVLQIKALSRPGLYGDGATLFLKVSPGGSKSWIQRLTINGKRHDIGLGGFPLVSLAEARELAFENRRTARLGGDPLAAKRKARMPTFAEAARKTHRAMRPRWRSAKWARTWLQQMERHAFPKLGELPVDRIGREHVLAVLTPIWSTKPQVARKLRRSIRVTLEWCRANGYVDEVVAGDAIDGALPRIASVGRHLRALPYVEIPAALDTIDGAGAAIVTRACLRLVILTAVRGGEARGARWSEIDLDEGVWRIAANRTKSAREHRVPLSVEAVEVLRSVRPLRDGSGLVFPSPVKPGNPISDMTMTRLLRDTGLAERATVHGFRSSFRDWCAETGKPREVAEAALAHVVGGTEGAYFRSDLFERRRLLMQQWAAFAVGTRSEKVVLLSGRPR